MLTDLLGVGIILEEHHPQSSESNSLEMLCQMDAGTDEHKCQSLTQFRHWSGCPGWLNFLLTSPAKAFSYAFILMHIAITSFSLNQSNCLAGAEFTEIATGGPNTHD